MLRNREQEHAYAATFMAFRALCSLTILFCILVQIHANPVPSLTTDNNSVLASSTDNPANASLDNDLYVIKAIVYEIGILTDADNTTSDTTERQEEVKISFFNQPSNDNESSKHLEESPAVIPLLASYNLTTTS